MPLTPRARAKTRLTKLSVDRVDLVWRGANNDPTTGEGSHILLWKQADNRSDIIPEVEGAPQSVENDVKGDPVPDNDDIAKGSEIPPPPPANAPVIDIQKAIGDAVSVVKAELEGQIAVEKAAREQVETELNEMRNLEAERVMKAHAERFAAVAAPEDLIPVLKSVSDPEAFEKLTTVLAAAAARIDSASTVKTGGLFGEIGVSKGVEGVDELHAVAEAIVASEHVPYAKAEALAMERNPALYSAYVSARRTNR